MTHAEELAAAEAALDRLLTTDPQPIAMVMLAYEAECALREREHFAWQAQQRLVMSGNHHTVRPWQIPLEYAWGAAEKPYRNQHTGQHFCKNGHEFTPENTLMRAGRPGRDCRRCHADRQARAQRRRKLQTA